MKDWMVRSKERRAEESMNQGQVDGWAQIKQGRPKTKPQQRVGIAERGYCYTGDEQ